MAALRRTTGVSLVLMSAAIGAAAGRQAFQLFKYLSMPDRLPASSRVNLTTDASPPNIERVGESFDWCSCGTGLSSALFWPDQDTNDSVRVDSGTIRWAKFSESVSMISWSCDGMRTTASSKIEVTASQWISLTYNTNVKTSPFGINFPCGKETGRLHWNVWRETSYVSSVPFTSRTEGYFCFKIPALLKTAKGTLIAFSEARKPGCSDFDETDAVYKRSVDGGRTWSQLHVLHNVSAEEKENLGICGRKLVVGNLAPLQLSAKSSRHPGRILLPYTRNNLKVWILHSDDDGLTWKGDREVHNVTETSDEPECNRSMLYFGQDADQLSLLHAAGLYRWARSVCRTSDPFSDSSWTSKLEGPWQFVGLGPPGSLQLRSGRLLIPGFHSYIRGLEEPGKLPISQLYNNFARGHVLISDDFGDTWRLGTEWPLGQGANENQLLELSNGSILSNSRSLSTGSPQWRLQARSDDEGEHFTASSFQHSIPQPFNGCQGSATRGQGDDVFVTSPDPDPSRAAVQIMVNLLGCNANLTGRRKLTLWKSSDGGTSYPMKEVLDAGLAAQTSLQYQDGKLVLLYEQADEEPRSDLPTIFKGWFVGDLDVLIPSRFIYRELPSFSVEAVGG